MQLVGVITRPLYVRPSDPMGKCTGVNGTQVEAPAGVMVLGGRSARNAERIRQLKKQAPRGKQTKESFKRKGIRLAPTHEREESEHADDDHELHAAVRVPAKVHAQGDHGAQARVQGARHGLVRGHLGRRHADRAAQAGRACDAQPGGCNAEASRARARRHHHVPGVSPVLVRLPHRRHSAGPGASTGPCVDLAHPSANAGCS